jgi:hypothetical protein
MSLIPLPRRELIGVETRRQPMYPDGMPGAAYGARIAEGYRGER